MSRLVIVGGSDAGISAGLRAREIDPTWDVTLIVADAYPNFSICGLPFYLSGETPDWRSLAHRTREDLEAAGLELLLDHRVMEVDAQSRTVSGTSSSGEFEFGYDRLVIGTGAGPIKPPIRGVDLPGVYLLHTMDDSFKLHDRLEGIRRAAVVGAGYIGLEMVDALRHRGIEVELFEQTPAVLPTVDVELGEQIGREVERRGVHISTGVAVQEIEASGDDLVVRDATGKEVVVDLVLVVVGVRPDTTLGIAAGIETGVRGALRVDREMRTNLPHVFAAGDCAETWHRLLQGPSYLPLGTTSHKQGRVAGENALGGHRQFEGSLGTQVVKVFDLAIARTGWRDGEARAAGLRPETIASSPNDHKAYYPGAHPLQIRVTGDVTNGRLLGAQIVGDYRAEVAKRIDVYAAALFHGMSVDGLSDLDLSYTPPLGSPWDAVQMAAQTWSVQAALKRETVKSAPASDGGHGQ
jgi:NADPH-dependent 2,4-dienoyl-CoA reductase/sulfur reductase-like enzyme